MKKVIFISFALVIFSSSCMTMGGGKQQLFIVEAPKDLKINYKGQSVELKKGAIVNRTPSSGGRYVATVSNTYPAIKIKLTKDTTVLELVSGNVKVPVKIKTKRRIGFLIWDGILTLGISPVVDILTKSHFHTNNYLIDVPAALKGSQPRSNKELWKAIAESQK